MGGGIAHLGRRGKESPKLKKKMLKKFSTYGLWGKAHRGPQGAAPKDLEACRKEHIHLTANQPLAFHSYKLPMATWNANLVTRQMNYQR